MTEIKQYSERDTMELDKVGGYYLRHVLAMTAEGLHSKSDIAAELGWRDMQIDALQEQVRALAAEKENARNVMLYAANNIAYAIFNLSDKKLSDLKRGLSDTTCPTDSALLAERELRSFAARIRSGEQP